MTGALPEWAGPLGLEPHPEGGWFAETWRSEITIPQSALPHGYPGHRSAGTSIYFLLMPGEESAWHTVRSTELWLHHRGSPIALELGGAGGRPRLERTVIVGPDIAGGQVPQALVPPGHWQRARPVDDVAGLVSCIVVPGFDFADFALDVSD
ncbi:cupin domain-containing protein [Gordonia soli]|uniref:DUF985 domain-containing protein n=1 Tax=Gordonia soli NBRC 108243 TaxID=1223545 RepID=M0QD92_9ACTN|nr:cupin domain-containing protein [Gordonia soli]GAC66389.1 hypothetical protein GS4_02_01000 [Gordonia soli NBRC 108243]